MIFNNGALAQQEDKKQASVSHIQADGVYHTALDGENPRLFFFLSFAP